MVGWNAPEVVGNPGPMRPATNTKPALIHFDAVKVAALAGERPDDLRPDQLARRAELRHHAAAALGLPGDFGRRSREIG